MANDNVRIVVEVDKSLHKAIKAKALDVDKTIKQLVTEALVKLAK